MTKYMDYASPNAQFTYDLSNSLFFRKDARNYINVLSVKQLNTLDNTSLLDIFLSTGNTVEPHYHENASELVYCISGAAIVSIINPFTNQLMNYPITPGQVANVPQGWWHYEIATVDNTHLLAIFNAPEPQVILGSDILRLTPTSMLAHSYCLNEALLKQALAPLTQTVIIGPPANCNKSMPAASPSQQQQPNWQQAPAPGVTPGVYNSRIGQQTWTQPYYPQQPANR
ncbi:cupin domain-containing protein [Paenibacillus koleovorans]|uniref:cupin domain-containing protein n=1 Tax=Paenibacillus koleovorans TaxID=121608 RepID=UPI000FDA19B3|nr:cupin domain-containing protein [Paenibacillus koleovorans]